MTLEEIAKIQSDKCPKFSVFARDKLPLPGIKRRLDDILNQEIIVTDFRITKSKKHDKSECLQIQFALGPDVYIVFTGSIVLINQIQSAKDNIPFKATIVKIDKYYSFS